MLAHLLYETLPIPEPGAHTSQLLMAVHSATACFAAIGERELKVAGEAIEFSCNPLQRVNGELVRVSAFLAQTGICSVDVIDCIREANDENFSNLLFDVPHVIALMAEWIKKPRFHSPYDDGVMGRGMKRYRS